MVKYSAIKKTFINNTGMHWVGGYFYSSHRVNNLVFIVHTKSFNSKKLDLNWKIKQFDSE